MNRCADARICVSVRLRALFAILIAVATLFAPLAIQSGAAMAMSPVAQSASMTGGGHCDEQPGKQNDSHKPGNDCCLAMCTGLAVVAAAPVEPILAAASVTSPGRTANRDGIPAKLPTPPPRIA